MQAPSSGGRRRRPPGGPSSTPSGFSSCWGWFSSTPPWCSTRVTTVVSGVGRDIADGGWAGYQHAFGGNATRAQRSAADVDLDTDLMRLARGGR